jgi:hypothetical protein
MIAELIVLRLMHIGFGVFWAGAIFFFVFFLEPSVRAAGPDGATVMRGIQQRHYLNILPTIAILTILSGITLYWRISAGFEPAWITSPVGLGYTCGGIASLIAFGIGFFVMRRSALKAAGVGAALQQASEGEAGDALMAQAQTLRQRIRTSARWVAVFLGIAVAAMAVARYL